VTPLYDLDNNITAYSCQIVKGTEDNGFIVVTASSDLFPIVQFSYTSKSPSEALKESTTSESDASLDKVYYTGAFDYFAGLKDKRNNVKFKSINGDLIERNDINKKFKVKKDKSTKNKDVWKSLKQVDRKVINELFVAGVTQPSDNGAENTYAGVITDPATYLKNRFGQSNTYTLDSSKTKKLENVGNWLQKEYESVNGVNVAGNGVNNCTLSALSNILIYWSANGYSKVPLDKVAIYSKVRAEAVKLGYTPTDGIGVTKNNNLVDAVWKAFGYTTGSGSNDYLWSMSTFKSEIDNNRPVIFSLASRPYYNHTIAVRGYTTYKNGSSNYEFLVVRDNWNKGDCYVSDQEGYFGCATYITPPSSK
jgi:hypothetical protein